MKLKESKNLVWSSTAQQDYYGRMSKEELISEIESDFGNFDEFLVWGGFDSIEDVTEDDIREYYLPSDIDLDYEDFIENIMPMVEKQCNDYNETLVLFGSAANWQGSREACAIIRAEDFKDYIYPDYDAHTKIYSDNGALFYTQSSHDTPMGGTALYLYSFKSDDDYEKASHLCDTEDWEGDFADDAEYKEVGEAIKQGFLTPVRNTFNESLEEGWYQFEYKSGANPYIAKTEKERDKILKKYGKKVTKIKDGFYEIDDKEEKMDSFNFDESLEKNLKEALSRYTFTDGMELTASSEEEVIQKYEDIEKNRNKGKTRPFETLNSIAEDLYEKEDDFSFHYFSDDELALLWGYCCVADASYDDEVYEAISDFPNKREIFAKAKEYAQKNVDFKLGEAYSQSDLMNAVQDAYGYSKKEAKKYIANADEKTKDELVKGYKDNAKRSFLTDSLKEGNENVEILHSVAEPFVDALDELEDRGEEVEITWNFGFDRDGNVTAGVDLRPTPRITKAKKTDELFKTVLPQFEKLMKQYGFVLDDNIKHENPNKNIFGGYHYQIKKIDLDECNIAEAYDLNEARYSDAYDEETRQNGWWYFTTHGVGPGTLPKDVHIIETREGQNEKGTWGDFIKLDGILNTDELKYFDLKELAPSDEEEDGWDRWETESSRDDWDSDEDFSGFFSDYDFNEAFINPKGSLSDYAEYLGKRSSSFGFSDDETAKKELKKRFPNITKSDLDKVIKRWHTGKLEEATSNKKNKKLTEADGGNITIETSTSILDMFYPTLYETTNDFFIAPSEMGELDNILIDVSMEFATEAIREVFPSATLKFEQIVHPKYYNYGGENILFDVTLPRAEYEAVKERAINDPNFAQFLKKNSPRDGYMPYGAYTVEKFKTQDDMYSIGQLVKFYANNDEIASDFDDAFFTELQNRFETYEEFWEDLMGWLKGHEQAYQDFLTHFNADENDIIDVDSIIDWIYDHDTLAKDFENHFGVSLNESLNEDKTPYGDTTIEDYVNANFSGSDADKQKFVAEMKKKANGKDYFNGLDMSVKDWEKEGQKFGLSMKRFPVTEGYKVDYLSADLAEKTNKSSIKNAYDRNELSIVSKDGVYWFEGCPERIRNTVFSEMKKFYPELKYLYDKSPVKKNLKEDSKLKEGKASPPPKKESSRVRELIDIIEAPNGLAKKNGYRLYPDKLDIINGGQFKITTAQYKRLKELGYGEDKSPKGSAEAPKGFNGRWNTTIESGAKLRKAINKGDYQGILNGIKDCYKEMFDKGVISGREFENWTTDIDAIDLDDIDDVEDSIDYELGNLYDACDNLNCWVAIDENLNEDTVKTSDGKWTNKGKEGTHGKFKTKKEADAQRKAMFANGFKG